jgi:hypothetical protein
VKRGLGALAGPAGALIGAASLIGLLTLIDLDRAPLRARHQPWERSSVRSFTAERNGLELTVVEYVLLSRVTLLTISVLNRSGPEVLVWDPELPPDPIWDARGFVLEKRSSKEYWIRHARACDLELHDVHTVSLRRGERWNVTMELRPMQSWFRDRPPAAPDLGRVVDTLSEVLDAIGSPEYRAVASEPAEVALLDLRVKITTPAAYSMHGPHFYPTNLSDDEIPWVELSVPLTHPLIVGSPRYEPPLRVEPYRCDYYQ